MTGSNVWNICVGAFFQRIISKISANELMQQLISFCEMQKFSRNISECEAGILE